MVPFAPEYRIYRIRNANKREYAIRYFDELRGIGQCPDEREFGISYMAAQAVRLQLHAIYFEPAAVP